MEAEFTILQQKFLGLDPRTLQLAQELEQLTVQLRVPYSQSFANEHVFEKQRRSLIKAFRLKSRALASLQPALARLELEGFIANYE